MDWNAPERFAEVVILPSGLSPEARRVAAQPVIADRAMSVMWAPAPSAQTMLLDDANRFAAELDIGGFRDWRLPNVFEMLSMVDPDKLLPNPLLSSFPLYPPLRKLHFGFVMCCHAVRGSSDRAWMINTRNGRIVSHVTAGFAWCVRSCRFTNNAGRRSNLMSYV